MKIYPILKKIAKNIFIAIVAVIFLIIILFLYFNVPVSKENNNSKLGITFSSRYASDIGLDPKETFVNILDGLHVKRVRIPVYWDLVEKEEGQYDFSDVDWQLEEARKRNVEVILVIGQKVPRWPECAIPDWLKDNEQKRKEDLIKLLKITIERYKDQPEIKYWQVENEPFLAFGICPKLDTSLLDREIATVRRGDSSREIILTDSGELSLWVSAARRADIFGTTMYRTIYKKGLGYFDYPIGPKFFQFKHWLIKTLAGQDRVIVIELQAEPWISGWTTEQPLSEQFQSMNSEKLSDNVSFAKKVGFPFVYLWGAEWWYWLKKEKNHPELWATAENLFNESR